MSFETLRTFDTMDREPLSCGILAGEPYNVPIENEQPPAQESKKRKNNSKVEKAEKSKKPKTEKFLNGFLFVVSWPHDKKCQKELKSQISTLGGTNICFEDYDEKQIVTLASKHKDRIFLICGMMLCVHFLNLVDKKQINNSRQAYILYALALGIPCINEDWLSDSKKQNKPLPKDEYLVYETNDYQALTICNQLKFRCQVKPQAKNQVIMFLVRMTGGTCTLEDPDFTIYDGKQDLSNGKITLDVFLDGVFCNIPFSKEDILEEDETQVIQTLDGKEEEPNQGESHLSNPLLSQDANSLYSPRPCTQATLTPAKSKPKEVLDTSMFTPSFEKEEAVVQPDPVDWSQLAPQPSPKVMFSRPLLPVNPESPVSVLTPPPDVPL